MDFENKFYLHTSGFLSLKKNKHNCILHDRKLGLDLVINRDLFDFITLCDGLHRIKYIYSKLAKKNKCKSQFIEEKMKSILSQMFEFGVLIKSDVAKYTPIRIRSDTFEYPLNYVYLEVTKRCNFSCIHCYANCPTLNTNNNIKKEMTLQEYYNLIDVLDNMGVMFIHITGGEPFMREDIFEILEYIHSKNIGFSILTNGSLLTEEKIKKLKTLLPRSILISFDSNNKNDFEKIRGNGRYESVLKNIKCCLENKLKIRVSAVLFEGINNSYDQLKSHFEFLKSLGLKTNNIAFDEFIPQGEGATKTNLRVDELTTMNNLKKVCLEVFCENSTLIGKDSIKNITSNTFCGLGTEMIYINCNGDVLFCPGLSDEKYKVDNIFINDLNKIWKYSKAFKYFRKKEYLKNSKCTNCDRLNDCMGGCKARSIIMSGDFSREDPWMCAYYGK